MGVKETKEVINLAKVITVIILKEVSKDGFQYRDLGAFITSPDFEAALAPAIQGIEKVGLELVDLDFFETLDLAKHVYSSSMDILDELKKVV